MASCEIRTLKTFTLVCGNSFVFNCFFRGSMSATNSAVIVRLLCGNSAVRAEKVRAKNKNVINLKKITASLTDAVIKMTYIVK